jgi:hypothetical protein
MGLVLRPWGYNEDDPGRTGRRDGKDSVVLAGGGVRPGCYGASDRLAAYPSSAPVSPDDLAATVYHLIESLAPPRRAAEAV